MRCRGDGSDIKIYSLSFRYNIEHISKQYGLQHATARNANALIVFGKLMLHLSTTGVGEYDHVNKLLHLMASAMMPLGNTDFGRFQAFGEMTSDIAIIKWMNEEKEPFPGFQIFYKYLDAKCKEHANDTLFQGQLRTSVLSDQSTAIVYETKTGRKKSTESVDTEYTKYVMNNWSDIGVLWFNKKVDETVKSLKVSACKTHYRALSH